MSEKRKPSQEQATEWFESPVTDYFFALISNVKGSVLLSLTEQGFDTDSAERLMGQRANLWGHCSALETVEKVFVDKSFEELEEEDSGEQIGDLPQSGSNTH